MPLEELLDFLLTVDTSEELLHLDFTLKLHQAVEKSLRTGRAARDIDIDRKNLVDTLHHAIRILERTAGGFFLRPDAASA